jgi:hypothetical protein
MLSRLSAGLAAALAGTFALVLHLGVTRGERILGWDEYHNLVLARDYALQLPDHLGGYYPGGYPLIASLAVRLGLHPYLALVAVSALAWVCLVWTAGALLVQEQRTARILWLLPFLGLVPSVYFLAFDAMSEMTFSLLVLLAVVVLGNARNATWAGLLCPIIIAAFATRYAGLFLIPASAAWLIYARWRRVPVALVPGLIAITLAGVVILVLLYSNIQATGYASGGPRLGGDVAPGSIIRLMADFGLGAVGFFSGGLAGALKQSAVPHFAGGLVLLVCITLIAATALFGSRTRWQGPAGMVILAYAFSMVALQSINAFDGLESGRFFLPILVPLVLVFACLPVPAFAVKGLAVVVAAIGIATAYRGISPETYGDISVARTHFEGEPPSRIFVNPDGAALAAYLDTDVIMVDSFREEEGGGSFKRATQRGDDREIWVAAAAGDDIAVVSRREGRVRPTFQPDPAWSVILDGLAAKGAAGPELSGESVRILRFGPDDEKS